MSPRPTRTARSSARLLVETARELGILVRDGGTVVVIQGLRFSTRAESKWFQDAGWDTINMTQYPEGHLARELELCYANISMVTDHDVGVEGAEPVSHEQVVTVFEENNEKLASSSSRSSRRSARSPRTSAPPRFDPHGADLDRVRPGL